MSVHRSLQTEGSSDSCGAAVCDKAASDGRSSDCSALLQLGESSVRATPTKSASLGRMRRPTLDEEKENETRRPTRFRATPEETEFWSPVASAVSSDEEIENVHHQPDAERRRTRVSLPKEPAHRESRRVSRSLHIPPTRPPARSPSLRPHRCNQVNSSDQLPLTLDERKQKKLVALFYWRRRTLETYFAVWKTLAFQSKRGSEQQRRELFLLRQYHPPVQVGFRPRHSNALLKTTLERQRRGSIVDASAHGSHRERMGSLRDEYRLLKENDVVPTERQAPMETVRDTEAAKRSAFKARLRVYFLCFQSWRDFLFRLKEEEARQFEKARVLLHIQRLRKCFRLWRGDFLAYCRHLHFLDQLAINHSEYLSKRWHFQSWRRWMESRRVLTSRANRLQEERTRRTVVRWRLWTVRTTRLLHTDSRRRNVILKRYLSRLKRYTTRRRSAKLAQIRAHSTHKRQLTARFWRQWKDVVFECELSKRLRRARVLLSYKFAIRKWKRFISRQRERYACAIQADYCLYDGLLRRYWHRWQQLVSVRMAKRIVHDRAREHRATFSKQLAIRALVAHRSANHYARDQAVGATQFYQQRCLRHILAVWNAEAIGSRRCREFRLASLKRECLLCFVAWSQHARDVSRLQHIAAIVERKFRARRLRASIGTWRYVRRLILAFRAVTARRTARQLLRVFHAWHGIAIRITHLRVITNHLTIERVRSTRKRVFYGWCRSVVELRCRCRLIRLFKTKQLFKKLRRCIQALQQHARVQQFLSSRTRQSIEGAWHAWVIFKDDEREQAKYMAIATEYHTTRSYGLAVELWKENVRRLVYRRETNTRAVNFLIQKILRSALFAWYFSARSTKRQRLLIISHRARRQVMLLLQCIQRWRRFARNSFQKRHLVRQRWCRSMNREREKAFFVWAMYYNNRKTHREYIGGIKSRLEQNRTRRIFYAWQTVAPELRRRRQVECTVRSRRRIQLLSRALSEWIRFARESRRTRSNKFKAMSFHREFLLMWAFWEWQHAALDCQLRRERARAGQQVIASKRLLRALAKWKKEGRLRRDHKELLRRAMSFHARRRHRKGLQMWLEFVGDRRCQQNHSKRARHFEAVKLLHRAFRLWSKFSSCSRQFKLKLRVVFQTGENDVLLRAFRCWRRYKRQSTLTARANQWGEKFLIGWIWRKWRAQVVFSRKMRSNVLITNRLLQSNATRTRFQQWKSYADSRRKRADAIRDGEGHFTRRCHVVAIRRFRLAVRRARAVQLSEAFHAKRTLRKGYFSWYQATAEQKHRRERKKFVITMYRSSRLSSVFYAWKRLVGAKQFLLEARAARWYGKLIVKHVWSAWRQAIARRSRVDRAMSRRLQKVLLESFREWRQTVWEEQQIRKQVEAAVAHMDRVIKLKIWESWQLYCDKRRESHRLDVAVKSFYSTSILLRRSCLAWKRYLDCRHAYCSQKLEADHFRVARSLRRCFDRLVRYFSHRRERYAKRAAEDESIRQLIAMRAIHKWQKRASARRTLIRSFVRGVAFHKERILTCAITSLTGNSSRRKQKLEQTLRASAFWKHQQLSQFFLQWIRFHSWRQRHKNLLRLFRSHQLNDYFGLWNRYVVRNHKKRALQKIAILGYQDLLQRRIFTHWRMRSRHWQQKRRAISWGAERLRRSALCLWAHRVRVLLKVRGMFRFQDSFRLETHFHAWKRRWSVKKKQLVCLRDAMAWFSRHRQAKCFALWIRWVDEELREKKTLRMALGFRKRFFSRKYLSAWRGVVDWRRREAMLEMEARQHYSRTLYHGSLSHLKAFALTMKKLRAKESRAEESLTALRMERLIGVWKRRLEEKRLDRDRRVLARQHFSFTLQRRCWAYLERWLALSRVKRTMIEQAAAHHRAVITRSVVGAWLKHTKQRKIHCQKLRRFKDRYFCNISDNYFSRWKAFAEFKQKLRSLKRRAERTQQTSVFQRWRDYTFALRRLKVALEQMAARQNSRLLRRCVIHWESVATDRWIHGNLLLAAQQRQYRQACRHVFQRWKSLLTMRRARHCWHERGVVRHRERLVNLLRKWRHLCDDIG